MSIITSPAQRGLWLMLLIATLIWFGNLEYRKLSLSDEGRYSEIPRFMLQSGDWLTPRLNGIKYFEKPPLQYWATALAFKVFGQDEWTARLWSALTGFLGILLIYWVGLRIGGRDTGLYAALVLASSFLYTAIAHLNTLDMGLTFFLSLTLGGLLVGLSPHTTERTRSRWIYAAWAAAALAVLSKGLIGIILPTAVVMLYMLIKRDFQLWRKVHLLSGGLLFFAISAPWFVAVSLANPEFPYFFFVHEHLLRYISTIHRRYEPWYYFLPVVALGVLPWLITLCDALRDALRHRTAREFNPQLFLLLWSGFIFLFFSLSDSKLPSYILPIFPAFALLVAIRLTTLPGRTLMWQLAPIALLAILGLFAVPYSVKLASSSLNEALFHNQMPWLYAAAAVLLCGIVAAMIFGRQGSTKRAAIICGFTGLITGQILLTSTQALAPAQSTYYLAKQLKPSLKPGVPIYSVGSYEQTLPFYIKRTVTLVNYQDEMKFGLEQEPNLWVPDLQTFERLWRQQDYALAVMGFDMYNHLTREALPMQVVASDTERVVVRTPPRKNPGDP